MNPFSNNRPRLTASEGIRNKRDKTIYQAEKQRFQNRRFSEMAKFAAKSEFVTKRFADENPFKKVVICEKNHYWF